MIAKISPRVSKFESVVKYNFDKVLAGNAEILDSNKIALDKELFDYTAKSITDSFYRRIPESCLGRAKYPVFHVSLNPHPDDKLSDSELMDIAVDYLKKMGYGKQPFIIFKHFDIDREHIHVISSRIAPDGRKMDNFREGVKSFRITNEIEEKYGLFRKNEFNKHIKPKPAYLSNNYTEQMRDVAKYVLGKYSFQSIEEFNLLLAPFNVQAEFVSTKFKGKDAQLLSYFLTNEKGERITDSINGYKVGRDVSHSNVKKHFYRSKKDNKNKLPQLKNLIDKVLKTKPNEQEFVRRLKEEGINCIIRYTKDGSRIYGVTFLSDDIGIVANGSRLGKEYSANSLNKLFNEQPIEENENDICNNNNNLNLNNNDALLETGETNNEEYSNEEYYEEEDSSLLLDIIPDININNGSDKEYYIKENQFQGQLKKNAKKFNIVKKKKGRRL